MRRTVTTRYHRLVAFLDAFGPSHRALLEGAARTLRLDRSEFLVRRGEPGGDVWLLRSGTLEVVELRSAPERILDTLSEGAVVGAVAFVDDSPRPDDIRAGSDAVLLRWDRDDLRSLLGRHRDLAAVFYESVARMAAGRARLQAGGASASGAGDPPISDVDELRGWVARIAETVKSSLQPVETALRRDPGEPAAQQKIREALDRLEQEVDSLFEVTRDPASRALAAEHLSRELHPYLVRSSLAERSIRRPQGVAGTAEILAHVLVDTAGGEGRLGELVDRWLLDRPTFRALRALKAPVVEALLRGLPQRRSRRVLLVNAGTGSLVAALVETLGQPQTTLTVLDQSRDALSLMDVGLTDRPVGVELRTIQESLVRFAIGRARLDLPEQDGIVIHGLLEYLPERMAVSLLSVVHSLLAEDGVAVIATLGPSRDRALLDRLLSWPTLRRTDEALEGLLGAVRLQVTCRPKIAAPGQLVIASPDDRTIIGPPHLVQLRG